jgi:hypothetical protein
MTKQEKRQDYHLRDSIGSNHTDHIVNNRQNEEAQETNIMSIDKETSQQYSSVNGWNSDEPSESSFISPSRSTTPIVVSPSTLSSTAITTPFLATDDELDDEALVLQMDRLRRQLCEKREQVGSVQIGNDSGLPDGVMFPFSHEQGSENPGSSFGARSRRRPMLRFRRVRQPSCTDIFGGFQTTLSTLQIRSFDGTITETSESSSLDDHRNGHFCDRNISLVPLSFPPFDEDLALAPLPEPPTSGVRFVPKSSSSSQSNPPLLPMDDSTTKPSPFRPVMLLPKWSQPPIQCYHSDPLPLQDNDHDFCCAQKLMAPSTATPPVAESDGPGLHEKPSTTALSASVPARLPFNKA